MPRTATTFRQMFEELQRVEGSRVALLAAAELLEAEHAATDMGPARRALRSEALFDTLVPEHVVLAMARELRRQAKALEQERVRLERATVTVKAAIDMPGNIGTVKDETPIAQPLRMAR